MFLSLYALPGYNKSLLKRYGFEEEFTFFKGNRYSNNNTTHISWGNQSYSSKGKYRIYFILLNIVQKM